MVSKVKWKVSGPPTGSYRSFEVRSWPSAFYADGRIAAQVICKDEYRPSAVKTGAHSELMLAVADYSNRENGFAWKYLTKRFNTLPEAKDALTKFLEHYPSYIPKDSGTR